MDILSRLFTNGCNKSMYVHVSIRAICNLVKKFKVQGSIFDLPRTKRANILTEEIKKFIKGGPVFLYCNFAPMHSEL